MGAQAIRVTLLSLRVVGAVLYGYVGLGSLAVAAALATPHDTVRGTYGPYYDHAAMFVLYAGLAGVFFVALLRTRSVSACVGNLVLGLLTTIVCLVVIGAPMLSFNSTYGIAIRIAERPHVAGYDGRPRP